VGKKTQDKKIIRQVQATKNSPPDLCLLLVTVVMVFWGIIMIFSSSAIVASVKFDNSYIFVGKQILWASMGIILLLFLSRVDYNRLHIASRPLIILSFLLLVAVLFVKDPVSSSGIHRWFRLGRFSFQPSEMAKYAVILFFADFIDRRQSRLSEFKSGMLPVLSILVVFLFLIYIEPDLGTTVSLGIVCMVLLFLGGIKLYYLLALILCTFPPLYIAIFSVSYRRERIMAFLNPWQDPQGKGYQLIQALVAMGSGGFWGKGLGASQAKLLYLPESYTDFIFPIIGEELGFLGASLIIALFVVFTWRGMKIAIGAPNMFGTLLAAGITFLIAFQAILNIGVVTGWLPTKGLVLPFLSFGGSSLVFNLMGVGILLSISRQAKWT